MFPNNFIGRGQIFILILLLGMFFTTHTMSQNRPKIGLVLSGGGARGFGHIGTLKMLDSLKIPVDYIVGTSMGGIIGALYAIGYSGLEIEELTNRTDWQEIFTDKPPRSMLPYFPKKESGRYQFEFGIQGMRPTTPSGLILGQKISLLFSSLTFQYERITNFDHLPIPFRCVAVDLVTGSSVVLKNGSLAKAMRSTMAIPTIFSPIEWGDSLLVDGGINNNLPVDVAQEMGADIVIAVDVGPLLMERKALNSIFTILEQTIATLGRDRWRENIEKVDILISPDLTGYSIGDFDNIKIKNIIKKGEIAAHQNMQDFTTLQKKVHLLSLTNNDDLLYLSKRPRIRGLNITGYTNIPFQTVYDKLDMKVNDPCDPLILEKRLAEIKTDENIKNIDCDIIPLSDQSVRLLIRIQDVQTPVIHGISIEGNRSLSFSFIYGLLGLNPGDRLITDDLNRRIMEMYGLGYFERVEYNIVPKGESLIHLNITIKESPHRKLRLGVRYDDMHKLVVAIGGQATNLLVPGLRVDNELQFAGLIRFSSKVYYPSRTLNLPVYPFFRFVYKDIPTNIFDSDGTQIADYKDRSTSIGIGMGFLFAKSFNTEMEYQHEYMNIKPNVASSDPLMSPVWTDNLRKINVTMNIDLLDNILLPRRGFLINAQYEGSFKKLNSDIGYYLMNISADFYHTFLHRHTLRFYGFWGTSSSLPDYKFLNQGRPHTFVGTEYDQLRGSQMSILRLDYRYQIRKELYVKLITNVALGLEYPTPSFVYKSHNMWGFGIGMKLITPIGPIEFIYSTGDKSFFGSRKKHSEKYYLLGYRF